MIQKTISHLLGCTVLLSSLCGAASVDTATTALFDALRSNNEAGIYEALNDGASVRATTHDESLGIGGLTVLHYAVKSSNMNIALLKLFLDRGAPVNALTDDGLTALHVLVLGYAEMASGYYPQMLSFDDRVDMATVYPTSPSKAVAYQAIEFHNLVVDMASLLVEHGADLNIKVHGYSPLDMAEEMQAKALIKVMKK